MKEHKLSTCKSMKNRSKNLKSPFVSNSESNASDSTAVSPQNKAISKSDLLFDELINSHKDSNNQDSSHSLPHSSSEQIERKISLKSFFIREDEEDASTLQEKGTMTEPILSKVKSKSTNLKLSVNKSVSTDSSTIDPILKIVTENKANDKVPLVVLSKALPLSKPYLKSYTCDNNSLSKSVKLPQKLFDSQDKRLLVSSVESLSPSEGTVEQTNVAVMGEISNDDSITSLESNFSPFKGFVDSNIDRQGADFMGFSPIKSDHCENPSIRVQLADNNDSSHFKRMQFNGCKKKKNIFSNEISNLDHSYSHGNKDTDIKTVAIATSKNLSPEGTKAKRSYISHVDSPDIMLHNDKINILRQMSQVFNNEKTNENKQEKASDKDEHVLDKELYLNEIGEQANDELVLNEEKSLIDKQNALYSSCLSSLDEDISPLTEEKVPIDSPTNTCVNLLDNLISTKEKDPSNKPSTSADLVLSSTLDSSGVSSKSIDSERPEDNSLASKHMEGLPQNKSIIPKKKKKIKFTKKKGKKIFGKKSNVSDKIDANIELGSKGHLIAEGIYKKRKSIKVKSYFGSQGEHVDIIDGFAFLSFNSEEELVKHKQTSPKKKVRKGPQKGIDLSKVDFVEYFVDEPYADIMSLPHNTNETQSTEPPEDIANVELLQDDQPDKSEAILSLNDANNSETCSDKNESVDADNLEKEASEDGNISSTAFSSDDLDTFLDQNTPLKISFEIPSCTTTEEGVTKYDEDGNIINTEKKKPEPAKIEPSTKLSDAKNDSKIFKVPLPPLSNKMIKKKPPFSNKLMLKNSSWDKPFKRVLSNKVNTPSVRRLGGLLAAKTPFQKRGNEPKISKEKVEMVYVYSKGRLIKIAGSLSKINPSNSNSVSARIALPKGFHKLSQHSGKIQKVQTVKINEDMAKFALSALISPSVKSSESSEEKKDDTETNTNDKDTKAPHGPNLPTKSKIADILARKLSLNSENLLEEESSQKSFTSDENSEKTNLDEVNKEGASSKIRWTHSDILKKGSNAHKIETSKAFTKNFKLFPSLLREMKRLNNDFVSYDKVSSDEEEDETIPVNKGECKTSHCKLGCVCDSLKCKKKVPEHCGRVECMFNCTCQQETWKFSTLTGKPAKPVSIFHLDKNHQEGLTVMEKDFKKTIVQRGSDLYILGAERKKRDVKAPERFRDNSYYSLFNSGLKLSAFSNMEFTGNESTVPPESYRKHIKPFFLDVPWYDIKGISIWCMVHSVYDCQCLKDKEFYGPEGNTETSSPLATTPQSSTTVQTKSRAVRVLPPKTMCHIDHIIIAEFDNKETLKWSIKYWTHNSFSSSARTAGYTPKGTAYYKINIPHLEAYRRPYPRPPYIMGKTVIKDHVVRKKSTKEELIELSSMIMSSNSSAQRNEPEIITLGDSSPSSKENQDPCAEKKSPELHSYSRPPKVITPNKSKTDLSTLENSISGNKKNLSTCLEGIVTAVEGNQARPKTSLSFNEMIGEEDQRGELELDLSKNVVGRSILVAESRFRKLINMYIIGIIGLNKAGRCIVDSVKSSDDLSKMQRIQRLINDNTIDVGPMKELFYPTVVDSKVRYVMIRCDNQHRWEIIGVVQRKDQISLSQIAKQRKKAQKNLAKTNPKENESEPKNSQLMSEPEKITVSDNSKSPGIKGIRKNLEVVLDCEMPSQEEVVTDDPSLERAQSVSPFEDLVIENNLICNELPMISSVHSGNDSSTLDLIGSPPTLPMEDESNYEPSPKKAKLDFSSNSPRSSSFGAASSSSPIKVTHQIMYDLSNQSNRTDQSLPVFTDPGKASKFIKLSPNKLQKLSQMFNSKDGSSNPSSTSSIVTSSLIPHTQNSLVYSLNTSSSQIFTPLAKNLPVPTTMTDTSQVSDNKAASSNSSCLFIYPQSSSASNAAPPISSEQGKHIQMLLLPSPTIPGKAFIIPSEKPSSLPQPLYTQANATSTNLSCIKSSRDSSSLSATNDVNIIGQTILQSPASSGYLPGLKRLLKKSVSPTNLSSKCHTSEVKDVDNTVSDSTKHADSSHEKNKHNIANPSLESTPKSTTEDEPYLLHKMSAPTKGTSMEHNDDSDIEEVIIDHEFLPDVKYLPVKNEKCTAVDLSIAFQSVKLHWLAGTIKKKVLDGIYKMSIESDIPIYLSVKNGTSSSVFFGMHCYKTPNSPKFPVLALGSKMELVNALSKQDETTLFRSNITKYFVRKPTGEMESYTYDAKGINLIKMAIKKRSNVMFSTPGGIKIPVSMLRQKYIQSSSPIDLNDDISIITQKMPNALPSVVSTSDDAKIEKGRPISPNNHSPADGIFASDYSTELQKSLGYLPDETLNKSITEKETAKILSENSEANGGRSKSFGIACFSNAAPSLESLPSPTLRKVVSPASLLKESPTKIIRAKSPKGNGPLSPIKFLTLKKDEVSQKDFKSQHVAKTTPEEVSDEIDVDSPYETPLDLLKEASTTTLKEIEHDNDKKKESKSQLKVVGKPKANALAKKSSISESIDDQEASSSGINLKPLAKSLTESRLNNIMDVMDINPTKKHNITERIRRKALGIMFNYLDGRIHPDKTLTNPPKKNILTAASSLIDSLKSTENELCIHECTQKEKRKELLKHLAQVSQELPPTELNSLTDWIKKNIYCPKNRKNFQLNWEPPVPEISDKRFKIDANGYLIIHGLYDQEPKKKSPNKRPTSSIKKRADSLSKKPVMSPSSSSSNSPRATHPHFSEPQKSGLNSDPSQLDCDSPQEFADIDEILNHFESEMTQDGKDIPESNKNDKVAADNADEIVSDINKLSTPSASEVLSLFYKKVLGNGEEHEAPCSPNSDASTISAASISSFSP